MKRIIFVVMAVALVGLAGFLIRQKFYSCDETCRILTADTYGGKTSDETLGLFVASLRAGDIELASKYFALDSDLPRDNWVKTLTIFKEQGLLDEMVRDIEKDPNLVELKLNEYSGIWKIENLR